MTAIDAIGESRPEELAPSTSTRWDRFEALLARLSEHLNPILVKEARQALRSRQFITTFFLMLSAGWFWSLLGLALMGPAVYYSTDGPSMFYVYHLILAFPLLVIAPFAAFYSLASERQDRTYELVSITALNARQILSGKLCGIMLQMMIYLSAIFPCLAFTYLLRGIDIFTILLAVIYTCAMSLGLSVFGLMLATLSPPRQRQNANGVLLAIVLFFVFFTNIWIVFGALVAGQGAMIDAPEFWQANLGLLILYANLFALVFLSARSQLTTVCQNRSTALRVALVVSQLSMLAWTAWAQLRWGGNFVFGFIFFSTFLWWFAGIFLIGEPPVLSARIKRELPQTLLGRILFSWFAPGPGTGYMFVIANMLAMSLMANFPFALLAGNFRVAGPTAVYTTNSAVTTGATVGTTTITPTVTATLRMTRTDVFETCVIATSYVIIYLGVGKWLMWTISRFGEVCLATRVLVNALLLMAGSCFPWIIQITNPATRNMGYTLLQITNPIWTIWECCGKGIPVVGSVLVLTLPAVALLCWLANLPALTAELKQVRIPKPPRVAEEDEQIEAAAHPVLPASPWD
jgi:hypothetical protein